MSPSSPSPLPIVPMPDASGLTRAMEGYDEHHTMLSLDVIEEKPLTLFLNRQEIVTMMTIGDYPEYLAVGYLLNQNMLHADDVITSIDYEQDIATIVVRTERHTDYEDKLRKKTHTSGCAVGTVFGDIMEKFDSVTLPQGYHVHISWIYTLLKKINMMPSLYLKAGAIHGCVLCHQDNVLLFMEDVGRHNAVDKIAGYMFRHGLSPEDKIFYTTGRLTSEMVIKT
ncbi:MAG: formate dehydrogenase accessory sulfurtransferase FdhD, partial [Alphaproteobacteria bacterium GM7ARS4]|nr:formate dehydrogenase accessory sulfurtransferase FdhD [Alphaproteobacteria bacterium GM7ARS4]